MVNEEVTYPFHTHTNYAKMLQDQEIVIDNNLMTIVNILMAHFNRPEGKMVEFTCLIMHMWLPLPI